MPGRVASVLLAAGAARRFGGRKQLALLEGRPLLDHALGRATSMRAGLAALRATYAGRPEHPVLVERELFERLSTSGDLEPGQILKAAGVEEVPCDDLGVSIDIDTPAQLAELTAHPPAQSGRPSSIKE
jgi:CTP:molybdopterin cytidylyltransferase MocA